MEHGIYVLMMCVYALLCDVQTAQFIYHTRYARLYGGIMCFRMWLWLVHTTEHNNYIVAKRYARFIGFIYVYIREASA